MYKLEILPVARQDMVDAVSYISNELENPSAASALAEEFFDAMEALTEFPYANPAYIPVRPLKHEYRKLLVKNYMILYWVQEQNKTITIARVVYAKRDYGRSLN